MNICKPFQKECRRWLEFHFELDWKVYWETLITGVMRCFQQKHKANCRPKNLFRSWSIQKTLKGRLRQGQSCYKQQELLGSAMYSSQGLHESVCDAVSTGRQQWGFPQRIGKLAAAGWLYSEQTVICEHCLRASSTCFDHISLLADICARSCCSCPPCIRLTCFITILPDVPALKVGML